MLKNAKVVSFFIAISRILGYIRDFFIAKYFGTSIYTDMFFIAFKMPNSLRRFLGEGAINSSVVPVLSKIEDKDRPKTIWNIIFIFTLILIFISILGVIFSKVLIAIFAAGFLHSSQLPIMNNMTQMIFPYIFFIGLSVLLMGILNTYNHFAIPAFAPALLNISIITSIILLFSKLSNPVYALCIGVIIGGILQLAISCFDFFRLHIPLSLSFKIESSTKEMLKLMSITAIGGGIFQLSSMVDTFLASFMQHGSFSYLFYANRLFQLPFAVFSIALTQSSIVDLSKMDKEELLSSSESLIKLISLISISVTLFFLFFAKDVIVLLFQHGKFNEISVNNTNAALSLMIIGFFFFSQAKILSNIFYAMKDAKTPLKASSISALFSIAASVVFGLMWGFKGLAISMSIAGATNMFALIWYINRKIGNLKFNTFIDLDTIFLFIILMVFSFGLKTVHMHSLIRLSLAVFAYILPFYIFYKKLHLK